MLKAQGINVAILKRMALMYLAITKHSLTALTTTTFRLLVTLILIQEAGAPGLKTIRLEPIIMGEAKPSIQEAVEDNTITTAEVIRRMFRKEGDCRC